VKSAEYRHLNKQILHLAIPSIIANLSVPLLSSVDTALVGHLPQSYFIGAVAVGGMIFNFIYWGFGFLRMGTTGLTAQAYGRQDAVQMRLVFTRAILVAAGSGLLLILLQKPIVRLSFQLIKATPQVEHFAEEYFRIRIWAAPATLAKYVIIGWFLGNQNMRHPLLIIVTSNLLNVAFDFWFVMGLGLYSDGVALGTVLAQYAGLGLGIFLLRRAPVKVFYRLNLGLVMHWPELKKFFVINRDIFIRTLSLVFAFSFFTAQSAGFGDTLLAANAILIQLWMIFSYGIDGFAYAAESLVGKYFGAGDKGRLKQVIVLIFLWGTGLGMVFSIMYLLFDRAIIGLFTNQAQVLAAALQFMVWTYAAPLINSVCYLWDGVFIGVTASKEMRNSMLAALAVFLLLFYLLHPHMGNHGIWLALTTFMVVRGVTMSLLAGKALRLKS